MPTTFQPQRRHFLKRGAGVGTLLSLPLLSACGGGGDAGTRATTPPEAVPPGTQPSTLFFNLSTEPVGTRTYYLTGGGRRYALVPTASQPSVLSAARQTNAFLRAVPNDQITHHVENALFSTDNVTVCYVSADIDTGAGTWSMSSIQLYIPRAAALAAYAVGAAAAPGGLLPLSVKRRVYGIAAATSADDLADERALFDGISHAATLVGMKPDLMSLDPTAAHIVHSNHVDVSLDLLLLSQSMQGFGPATPEAVAGVPNPGGWATLVPMADDAGQPLRNTKGQHAGRLQYQPRLHPQLRAGFGRIMNTLSTQVRNDAALGADITAVVPDSDATATATRGALWLRRDGYTAIDLSPGSGLQGAPAAQLLLKQQNPQSSYLMAAELDGDGADRQVRLAVTNWFLEFRGIFLQFLDADGQVIALADLDEYANGSISPDHDKAGDTTTEMFLDMIGPVFTLAGVPLKAGAASPEFTVPAKASTVRVLSSGLSIMEGIAYPGTVLPGAAMTGVFNYGVTGLLAASGAGIGIAAVLKGVSKILKELSNELVDLLLHTNSKDDSTIVTQLATSEFWADQALAIVKTLVTEAVGQAMEALAELIADVLGAEAEGVAQDAVPVAGQILEAVSLAVGAANLLQTTWAVANAPATFVDDLVFTRDLAVTLVHDPRDGAFPAAANSYTVTVMFDGATPYTQTLPLASGAPVSPVLFGAVPDGGTMNVSVAFVQTGAVPGAPDILLGKGSTGAIPNNAANNPTITIQEIAFPISASTVYAHRRRTALAADGSHAWVDEAAPTATSTACGDAGSICAYRGITVQQGTATSLGYLGYAWQAQNGDSSRAPSCIGGGAGQLDQLASITNPEADAQSYALSGCGLGVPGAQIAYSLLAQGSANFYIDTSALATPIVRQVLPGTTPTFQPPGSNLAFGVLNNKSDGLSLHPAGKLVSINRTLHKLEVLTLPKAALSDAEAQVSARAYPISGPGTGPGLLDTPVAVAITATGVILVLEGGNNRIQALDLGGNPVRYFNHQAQGVSPYSLTLAATPAALGWTYLDMAVEFTGFIYVLASGPIDAAGNVAHRLDIYHPDQPDGQPVATTHRVYAARLAVDLWRNLYTLNYEVMTLNGQRAPVTEPSISFWTPSDVGG